MSENAFDKKFARKESAPKPPEMEGRQAWGIPAIKPVERKNLTVRLLPTTHWLLATAVNEAREKGQSMTRQSCIDEAVYEKYSYLLEGTDDRIN